MTIAASLLLFQPSSGANPIVSTVGMYGLMIAIFYFVLLRPQQQQRKKHEASIRAVKKGDEVVTSGGVVGEVIHIKTIGEGVGDTDRVTLKSGESRFIIERRAISRVVVPVVTTVDSKGAGGTA